jgi:hypothetical protein
MRKYEIEAEGPGHIIISSAGQGCSTATRKSLVGHECVGFAKQIGGSHLKYGIATYHTVVRLNFLLRRLACHDLCILQPGHPASRPNRSSLSL